MDVAAHIEAAYSEVCSLLPALPTDIRFELEPSVIVPGWGVGGFCLASDRILIGVDASLDEAFLASRLRAAVFHECFHVAQGHTFERVGATALEPLHVAVWEGCATVFERDRAASDSPWAQYLDDATMLAWAHELAALPPQNVAKLTRWLFWDPVTQRQHVIYRTGTFLVDRVLADAGVQIEALASWSAEEILAAAALA